LIGEEYGIMRIVTITALLAFSLTSFGATQVRSGPVPRQQSPGPSVRELEVNETSWVKIRLPPNCSSFQIYTNRLIKVKYVNGQQFELLPYLKEFQLPDGTLLRTSVIKISGTKHEPVKDFGTVPTNRLYLKSEGGSGKVRVSWEETGSPVMESALQKCLKAKDQLERLNKNLTDELIASKRTISDLSAEINTLKNSTRGSPESVLELAKSSQRAPEDNRGQLLTGFEQNGKIHIVRELVIGTLYTEYDKEVKAGDSIRLKAVFKPHPILNLGGLAGATEERIRWYTELQYNSQKSKVDYDDKESGGKQLRRELDPSGSEETWVWTVTPQVNFRTDVSDLILYAGYRIGDDDRKNDVLRESIKITEASVPGLVSRVFRSLRENSSTILSVLSAFLLIWSTLLAVKKTRLETSVKGLELEIKKLELKVAEEPASQTQPPSSQGPEQQLAK
jgi:hypothetical protein